MVLWMYACSAGPPVDTAADTDADTDTDTDADTDADADTDTDAPGELGARLVVSTHPEVATVLVATWDQLRASDGWLSWEFEGVSHTSPRIQYEPGVVTQHVFGLPAATATTVTLHLAATGYEQTHTENAATLALPDIELAATSVLVDAPGAHAAQWFLTSVNVGVQDFFGPCYVVIVDRAGRVVWYRPVADRRLTLFPRVARDGSHVLWDATTYYVADAEASISRATLSLSSSEEVYPPGLGFTWDEDVDGTWIYDESVSPYEYYLSRYAGGVVERIWACAPWMEPHSVDYWACAANTTLAGAPTGELVYSMFQTSTIVGVDPSSGAVLWELGDYPGGLGFDPEDVGLSLQHYPNWTPDGTLLLTTHVDGVREQHIREFAIDTASNVATQVWEYVPEIGYYGDYAGEATRLDNGNTLVSFGSDGVVQEVTPSGEVVWELDWSDHLLGHLTPVADLYALDAGW